MCLKNWRKSYLRKNKILCENDVSPNRDINNEIEMVKKQNIEELRSTLLKQKLQQHMWADIRKIEWT